MVTDWDRKWWRDESWGVTGRQATKVQKWRARLSQMRAAATGKARSPTVELGFVYCRNCTRKQNGIKIRCVLAYCRGENNDLGWITLRHWCLHQQQQPTCRRYQLWLTSKPVRCEFSCSRSKIHPSLSIIARIIHIMCFHTGCGATSVLANSHDSALYTRLVLFTTYTSGLKSIRQRSCIYYIYYRLWMPAYTFWFTAMPLVPYPEFFLKFWF